MRRKRADTPARNDGAKAPFFHLWMFPSTRDDAPSPRILPNWTGGQFWGGDNDSCIFGPFAPAIEDGVAAPSGGTERGADRRSPGAAALAGDDHTGDALPGGIAWQGGC